MYLGGLELRVAWVPAAVALVVFALFISLGRWQLGRAQEKRVLQQAMLDAERLPALVLDGTASDGERLRYRRLQVTGEFDAARQIFLDNKVEDEQAGYHVLTPLKMAGASRYVLVNRGWIARGPAYPVPPVAAVPAGVVTVQGYGALPAKRFLELSPDAIEGAVWQNLTFDRYRRATGLSVLPFVLEQVNPASPGLRPVRERPEAGMEMHQGYALQWFSLAAAVVVVFALLSVRRGR